ncbi:TIGR01244 family sulfur transferase [Pelagerythrobacter aerophilus]
MSDFRTLSDTVLASPQIDLEDIAEARAEGVTLVINNRPDGESEDQTPGAEIEAAARAAGLDYIAIPIGGSGFGERQVQAMADALAEANGKVLAYCRSGTRSTLLWSLAQAQDGRDPEEIAAAAAAAGYDITPVRPAIDMLAARARG